MQHDVLHDCKPQSRAARIAGARFIHAVKTFRQPRNVFLRNADAVVANLYFGAASSRFPALGMNVPALGGITQRVRHQVHHGTSHLVDVTFDPHVFSRAVHRVASCRYDFHFRRDAAHQIMQRNRFAFFVFAAVFQPGKRKEIVNDALHALRLVPHEREMLRRQLHLAGNAGERHIQKAGEHRQGRAQFVRNIRDEIPTHGVHLRLFRHVASD